VRGDVPDRATGGAKLGNTSIGSVLTENRLGWAGVSSVSDLVKTGDGSVAGSSAGRETRDDEMFTETTDSNWLVFAGDAVSKVSENERGGHDEYLSSLFIQVEVHSRPRGSVFTWAVGVSGVLEHGGTLTGNGVPLGCA